PAIAKVVRRIVDESLREMGQIELKAGVKDIEYVGRVVLTGQFVFDLPPSIRDALKLSPDELKRLQLKETPPPIEMLGILFEPSEFWDAVATVLDRGKAAIVKKATRVQFRRDANSGHVTVRRLGQGAKDGGRLNPPFLMLLSRERNQRLATLHTNKHLFDLPETERQQLFERLAGEEKPSQRMRLLYDFLDTSAAWYYSNFEETTKDPSTRAQPFNIGEMMPRSLSCLRNHLGLISKTDPGGENSWSTAVEILLNETGLEESLVRLSCLPSTLPKVLFERFDGLNEDAKASLMSNLNRRLQSPLQRVHFLALALRHKEDLPRMISQAKHDLAKLLSPESGIHAVK